MIAPLAVRPVRDHPRSPTVAERTSAVNPKHSVLLAVASAAGAAAALLAAPGTYGRLRRRAGLSRPGPESDPAGRPPRPGPVASGPDARASLRARLAEERRPGPTASAVDVGPGPAAADDGDRVRAAVEETRARARRRAVGAFGPPADRATVRRPG